MKLAKCPVPVAAPMVAEFEPFLSAQLLHAANFRFSRKADLKRPGRVPRLFNRGKILGKGGLPEEFFHMSAKLRFVPLSLP
jgi:hypothetical protein